MKTRGEYEKAVEAVGTFVRSWDPYSLLAEGAPADEFDAEIARLVTHIPYIRNADTAANAISAVFSASFEPELFTPALCINEGEQLFGKLVAADLVSPA